MFCIRYFDREIWVAYDDPRAGVITEAAGRDYWRRLTEHVERQYHQRSPMRKKINRYARSIKP